nr:hypothetical protein [Rhodobium orientis]
MKSDLGDLLEGRAGPASVDHPQHLAEIASAIGTDALVGLRSSEAQSAGEPPDRIHTIVKKTIEKGGCRHRSLRQGIAEIKGRKVLACNVEAEIVPFGRAVGTRIR